MEQKLEKGLKRWAEAGKPTMDLEGYVKARLAREQQAAQAASPAAPEGAPAQVAPAQEVPAQAAPAQEVLVQAAPVIEMKPKPRRWTRWAAAAAMVAGIFVTANATFPMWAGAATTWPVVGPYVTEVIMRDVGMKWAYDAGLVNTTNTQVQLGDVTIKVLGIVADPSRTTVLYQVLGYKAPGPGEKAGRVGDEQHHSQPAVFVASINGQGVASGTSFVTNETPYGHFGISTTLPLETEEAVVELAFDYNGQRAMVEVPVSRKASSALSREVPVGKSVSKDGVTLTVESVIYTPVETVVKYQIEKDIFWGVVGIQGLDTNLRVIQDGQEFTASHSVTMGKTYYTNFPTTEGGGTLVLPGEVVGRDYELTWPLEVGATQQVSGESVTVMEVSQSGNRFDMRWSVNTGNPVVSIGGFELVLKDGTVLGTQEYYSQSGGAGSFTADGTTMLTRHVGVHATLPDGAEVVSVRTKQVGIFVEGPWVVELPQK